MRVLAISGSPKKGGFTDLLLDGSLDGARAAGAGTDKIILNDLSFKPCQECFLCEDAGACVVHDDMSVIHKKIKDADTRALLSKVKFEYPEGSEKGAMELTSEITIKLKDGKQYIHKVVLPKGEPENPMTDEELDTKFINNAGLIMNKRNVNKILNQTRNIEDFEDLSGLFKVLRKS